MYSIVKGIKVDAVVAGVPNRWIPLDEEFGGEDSRIDQRTLKKFKKNVGVEDIFPLVKANDCYDDGFATE